MFVRRNHSKFPSRTGIAQSIFRAPPPGAGGKEEEEGEEGGVESSTKAN